MTKLLLIDGDELLHRNLVSLEHEVRWAWGIHTLHVNEDEARAVVETKLHQLLALFEPEQTLMAFSGPYLFRKQIDPSYKSNRVGQRKPLCFAQFRNEILEQRWPGIEGVEKPLLEADDVLAILATKPGNEDHVLVSQDKDFNGVPCRRMTGTCGVGQFMRPGFSIVHKHMADRFHLLQTLMGDRVDGYSGCPGVGPVMAEKLVGGGWPAVVHAFNKAGLTEEDALVQARLARLVRWDEWDQEKQEVKLWTPPQG